MLDWVDVVRRLLHLYCVKTQQELSMAMGMPVDVGTDGAIDHKGIPWQILEKAVSEMCVSWDWLMTGKGDGPVMEDDNPEPAQHEKPQQANTRGGTEAKPLQPPRFETRELVRELIEEPEEENCLHPSQLQFAQPATPQPQPTAAPQRTQESTGDVVKNLRELRRSMQSELRKLDQVLADSAKNSGQDTEDTRDQATYA